LRNILDSVEVGLRTTLAKGVPEKEKGQRSDAPLPLSFWILRSWRIAQEAFLISVSMMPL
jgi:hypothetical protein